MGTTLLNVLSGWLTTTFPSRMSAATTISPNRIPLNVASASPRPLQGCYQCIPPAGTRLRHCAQQSTRKLLAIYKSCILPPSDKMRRRPYNIRYRVVSYNCAISSIGRPVSNIKSKSKSLRADIVDSPYKRLTYATHFLTNEDQHHAGAGLIPVRKKIMLCYPVPRNSKLRQIPMDIPRYGL